MRQSNLDPTDPTCATAEGVHLHPVSPYMQYSKIWSNLKWGSGTVTLISYKHNPHAPHSYRISLEVQNIPLLEKQSHGSLLDHSFHCFFFKLTYLSKESERQGQHASQEHLTPCQAHPSLLGFSVIWGCDGVGRKPQQQRSLQTSGVPCQC